ncbi:MAG: hypothetical protein FJX62_12390 [Alphaproteobacteria bacterium]|nr:hypothetical protein [Alphaproteobacteria bacterium]
MPSPLPRNSVVLAVSLFAALCLFYSAWPVWRALFPIEIDLNEAWNAYHADAAVAGRTLYPDPAGLVANNYPPLSYVLIGWLSLSGVDAIYIGRALSLLATGTLAITAALCILQLGGGRIAAALGGFWFLGTMVRHADWYVGMNDPHLLALAIMGLALLWYLRRGPGRAPEPIVLMLVLAGFVKHTLVAFPAAVLLDWARHNWRFALRGALAGIAASGLGLVLCTAWFGTDFLAQMFLSPRQVSLDRALKSLERIGGIAPVLIVWAVWAWHDRKSEAAKLTTILVGCSFAVYAMQKSGYNVDVNAQFELNLALAIGLGLAVHRLAVLPIAQRLGADKLRLAIVGVLAAGLLAAPGLEPYWLAVSSDYRDQFRQNSEVVRSETARIAAIRGDFICTTMSVCRAAGKRFVHDESYTGQKITAGVWDAARWQAELVRQRIGWQPIDPRAGMRPLMRQLPWGRTMPSPRMQ